MPATCANCSTEIKLTDRVARGGLCKGCSTKKKAARDAARAEYEKWIAYLSARPLDLDRAPERIPELEPLAEYSAAKLTELKNSAIQGFAKTALWDDVISIEEEDKLQEVAEILSLDQAKFNAALGPLQNQLVVGQVNDGRLPVADNAPIILGEGETAHVVVPAYLTKEVAIREYQAGYSGVSFKVAKGVRYHTGGARGRSVVVGTETQLVDSGNLVVTSSRCVYIGSSKTFEFAHKKLVSLQLYSDGVLFHVSNRQNAQLINMDASVVDVVGAVVNASAQRLLYG